MRWFRHNYLGTMAGATDDWRASPLLAADHAGLPPPSSSPPNATCSATRAPPTRSAWPGPGRLAGSGLTEVERSE